MSEGKKMKFSPLILTRSSHKKEYKGKEREKEGRKRKTVSMSNARCNNHETEDDRYMKMTIFHMLIKSFFFMI